MKGSVRLPALPPIAKQRLERTLRPLIDPDCAQSALDLAWQGLDKDDTKAVAIMLLHNRSIRSLDFRGNKPTRRGIKVRLGIIHYMIYIYILNYPWSDQARAGQVF